MNWPQLSHKRRTENEVSEVVSSFILTLNVLTATVNFPGKFYKTFIMQNRIKTRDNLCTELGPSWPFGDITDFLLAITRLRGKLGWRWFLKTVPKQYAIWHNTDAKFLDHNNSQFKRRWRRWQREQLNSNKFILAKQQLCTWVDLFC